MVCLDSLHTNAHVLKELEIYAPMVAAGGYCVVFDTIVELMPGGHYADRPWDRGNSPKTAVDQFLRQLKERPRRATDGGVLNFEVDKVIDNTLLISSAVGGYLKRVDAPGRIGKPAQRESHNNGNHRNLRFKRRV